MCKMCCVNGPHEKNILNIRISRHAFVCHHLWKVLAKFHGNRSYLRTLLICSNSIEEPLVVSFLTGS